MDADLKTVQNLIAESNNIVFFGGAGVSTASGIPDFRSATGLTQKLRSSPYAPEKLLSHAFLMEHPAEFYDFHLRNLVARDAQPNQAHLALASLEKEGKLKAVITQNVDGLHQKAGSRRVIELHGNTFSFYCMACNKVYDPAYVEKAGRLPPLCTRCGGIVRPDVVLYGEALKMENLQKAIRAIQKADVFIVGGTSLVVYPAAGLLNHYKGDKLLIINHTPTAYDSRANYVIHGKIAEVLPALFGISH
ncbi:MAG: NAD-dependent protein deacylase [Anaerolineaceae bacterium]|nr:NAD-dependent protein deacylase [Anaerolineaceae bacterium]